MSVAAAHKLLFGRLYHSIWNERRLEYIEQVFADTHALGDPTIDGQGWVPRPTGAKWSDLWPDCRT